MQPTEIIMDHNNELFCIVDPLSHLQLSTSIARQSLVECRFCKSLCLPTINLNGRFPCPICQCVIDLPNNYFAINPAETGTSILAVSDKKTPKKSVRIMLMCETEVIHSFKGGLQALSGILNDFLECNGEIGLIMFDKRVRLFELEEEGRVFILNPDTYQLVTESFVPITSNVISKILNTLNNFSGVRTTLNPFQVLVDMQPHLNFCKPTSIILLAHIDAMTSFQLTKLPLNLEMNCILQVPNNLSNYSQIQNLAKLGKICKRLKLINKEDNNEKVINKVYYELYASLWDSTVAQYKVQASRERKYPPEILTTKQTVIGSLKDAIVIKLGKNVEQSQKIQIRIKFSLLKPTPPIEQCEFSRKLYTLIITIPTSSISNQSLQLTRYIHLRRIITNNPNNLTIKEMLSKNKNQIDDDVLYFWKQASINQKYQLLLNRDNPNCLYTIWPFVGMTEQVKNHQKAEEYSDNEDQAKSEKKVDLIYYFTGYHIPLRRNPSQQHIQQLNQMCQLLYSPPEKSLMSYYLNIIQDAQCSQLSEQEGGNQKYYEFKVQNKTQ